NKNVCTEYSIILDSTTAVKRRDELNADKQLHYDDKKNEWINDSKNLVWTLTKNEEEYLLSCKKL
ncbi:MAG: hypothetical protein JWO06_2823, partial [Bacteroidota bacterium]|nr:hypothetical protein [Bacteroidota bacterium]